MRLLYRLKLGISATCNKTKICVFFDREFKQYCCVQYEGTRWRSWLRHCATNAKVADSIPDGITGVFQ